MDIRDYPEVVETINAILTNKGTAEVKVEKVKIVVVETTRQVKKMTPAKVCAGKSGGMS